MCAFYFQAAINHYFLDNTNVRLTCVKAGFTIYSNSLGDQVVSVGLEGFPHGEIVKTEPNAFATMHERMERAKRNQRSGLNLAEEEGVSLITFDFVFRNFRPAA